MRKQDLLRDIVATDVRALAITRQECEPGHERGSIPGGQLSAAAANPGAATDSCCCAEFHATDSGPRASLHVSHLIHRR